MLTEWKTRRVLAVADEALQGQLASVHVVHLPDEAAVTALAWRHLQPAGPVQTLVVANPADHYKDLSAMSALAPYLAIKHRAALVLTDDHGENTAAVVGKALKHPRLRGA